MYSDSLDQNTSKPSPSLGLSDPSKPSVIMKSGSGSADQYDALRTDLIITGRGPT